MNICELYKRLVHASLDKVRETANAMGLNLTGKLDSCESCALAKARQANLNKKTVTRFNIPGKRLCIDISSPTAKSLGGKCHWLLVLDDCKDLIWSYFLKEKFDLQHEVICLIKDLK